MVATPERRAALKQIATGTLEKVLCWIDEAMDDMDRELPIAVELILPRVHKEKLIAGPLWNEIDKEVLCNLWRSRRAGTSRRLMAVEKPAETGWTAPTPVAMEAVITHAPPQMPAVVPAVAELPNESKAQVATTQKVAPPLPEDRIYREQWNVNGKYLLLGDLTKPQCWEISDYFDTQQEAMVRNRDFFAALAEGLQDGQTVRARFTPEELRAIRKGE